MTITLPKYIETLISKKDIALKVKELGKKITDDYRGKPLTLLVVLKGSFVFAADLAREIDLPLNIEFIGLKSYGNQTSSSGVVQITMDVKHPLENQHVLVVEDIVDTGLTLHYLFENLLTRNPLSLKLATLLHKPSRTQKEIKIDYLGFTVPNKFVVGCGMDFDGKYRNLPHIGVLKPQKG